MNVAFVSEAGPDGAIRVGFAVDGGVVETVYLPSSGDYGVCLSTQTGCNMGCRFCATAEIRPARSLAATDIADQVSMLMKVLGLARPPSHITLSGMGEPLAHLKATLDACSLLSTKFPNGAISLSTVGLKRPMEALVKQEVPYRLYLSLHAATDATRRRIIPSATKTRVETLVDLLAQYGEDRPLGAAQVSYLLLRGVNDSDDELASLIELLRTRALPVQLLMFNSSARAQFEPVDPAAVEHWRTSLISEGVISYVRPSQGREIEAGCGQLTGLWKRDHRA